MPTRCRRVRRQLGRVHRIVLTRRHHRPHIALHGRELLTLVPAARPRDRTRPDVCHPPRLCHRRAGGPARAEYARLVRREGHNRSRGRGSGPRDRVRGADARVGERRRREGAPARSANSFRHPANRSAFISAHYDGQVFDVAHSKRISYVERPPGAPAADSFRCHLRWEGSSELLIGWADSIKIGVLRNREGSAGARAAAAVGAAGFGGAGFGAGASAAPRYLEIVALIQAGDTVYCRNRRCCCCDATVLMRATDRFLRGGSRWRAPPRRRRRRPPRRPPCARIRVRERRRGVHTPKIHPTGIHRF